MSDPDNTQKDLAAHLQTVPSSIVTSNAASLAVSPFEGNEVPKLDQIDEESQHFEDETTAFRE